jgi:hypothetical protein
MENEFFINKYIQPDTSLQNKILKENKTEKKFCCQQQIE